MRFSDTTALITGASRGLGAALARGLGRRGARVALVARDAEALEAVAAEIRGEGGRAHAIPADVGDKQAIHAACGAAAALVGPIDLVVHDAATLGPTPLRLLADTECEELERVLAVNLLGPFRLTRALVGHMLLRERGTVVAISSDAATCAYPRWGAYGVSKAALDQLMRIWAAELEGTGVRFLRHDPGEMNTRMHAEALPDADPATLTDPAEAAERLIARLAEEGA